MDVLAGVGVYTEQLAEDGGGADCRVTNLGRDVRGVGE